MKSDKLLKIISLFILSVFLLPFNINAQVKQEKPAKYIFYLIGDGMGLAQVSATEAYLSEMNGKVGGAKLSFSEFPVAGVASTYSANRGITCSSAAGTALATGTKTKNNMLGLDVDSLPLKSIAVKFKEAGYKVGITTTVGVNHATPAAFYGHQDSRSKYYEIGLELPTTQFDFFGGSSMLHHKGRKKDKESLYDIISRSGYGIARGVNQYDSVKQISKKMLLVENPDTLNSLAYAIDRKGGELTLPFIVEKAISFLNEDNDKGFFLMIEGGKIDWSCHSNDGATTIQETLDFEAAVNKVLEFYNQHPDETLIVITADHETGGMALGYKSGYKLNTKVYKNQKLSKEVLSEKLHKLSVEKKKDIVWEDVKLILQEELGFWKTVKISKENEEDLKECFKKSFLEDNDKVEKGLYATVGAMANLSISILNNIAQIGWTTSSHSGIPVPVYAKGTGCYEFSGHIDNTDIPKKIMKVAGVPF